MTCPQEGACMGLGKEYQHIQMGGTHGTSAKQVVFCVRIPAVRFHTVHLHLLVVHGTELLEDVVVLTT